MKPSGQTPLEYVQVEEQKRLNVAREEGVPWKKWGLYLSERQWDTVREDYSEDGNAWDYFSHDQSRSRAYRWDEDEYRESGKDGDKGGSALRAGCAGGRKQGGASAAERQAGC